MIELTDCRVSKSEFCKLVFWQSVDPYKILQYVAAEQRFLVWFDSLRPSEQLWSCQDGQLT